LKEEEGLKRGEKKERRREAREKEVGRSELA
jgi:hypothetical protein